MACRPVMAGHLTLSAMLASILAAPCLAQDSPFRTWSDGKDPTITLKLEAPAGTAQNTGVALIRVGRPKNICTKCIQCGAPNSLKCVWYSKPGNQSARSFTILTESGVKVSDTANENIQYTIVANYAGQDPTKGDDDVIFIHVVAHRQCLNRAGDAGDPCDPDGEILTADGS